MEFAKQSVKMKNFCWLKVEFLLMKNRLYLHIFNFVICVITYNSSMVYIVHCCFCFVSCAPTAHINH